MYDMCCSYMVLSNPHMKPRIQFIIIKIFMKIVKICPKSPWFTVPPLVGPTIIKNIFKMLSLPHLQLNLSFQRNHITKYVFMCK